MKKKSVYIFFIILCLFINNINSQNFADGEIVAKVNNEVITQSELVKLLERSYGEEAKWLRNRIARFHLEEMVIFKVIEQKIKNITMRCRKEDYLEDVGKYEKPFFTYYLTKGLKTPFSFIKKLSKLLEYDKELKSKYQNKLLKIRYHYRPSQHNTFLLDVWKEMLDKKKIKYYLRKKIFKKFRIDYKTFKRRIKLITKFRKIVLSKISSSQIKKFAQKEKFALSDGLIKMNHILLITLDRETQKPLSEKRQEKIRKKLIRIKNMVKKDFSNFSMLAQKYSDDNSTKYKKGSLGWVPRWTTATIFSGFLRHIGWMPHITNSMKAIVDYAYHYPKNKLSDPIKSQLGYHIIVVTERKNNKKLDKKKLYTRARDMLTMLKMEELLTSWIKKSEIEQFIK